MKNKFTTLFKFLIFAFILTGSTSVFAQPSNDNCIEATGIPLAADQASCVQTDGDTRMTVDATTVPGTPAVCSGSWYTDDVWFSVDIGATVPTNGIVVETEFGTQADDVPAVGMAFYRSCDATETAIACFSNGDGTERSITIQPSCLEPNNTYIVRVWSGVSPADNSGTFRICAYENPTAPPNEASIVLWEDDFENGMGDWTTTTQTDSTDVWIWSETGAFSTFTGGSINHTGPYSSCSAAMCFPGGWYQTGMTGDQSQIPGDANLYEEYISELISPAIDLSNVTSGVSLKFDQTFRRLNVNASGGPIASVSYSTDGGSNWSDDIEVNGAEEANGPVINDIVRVPLTGAQGNSDVRVRFTWRGDFYFWIVDRVQIVEIESNNLRANPFYAIAPNLLQAKSQTDTIRFLIDVENVGGVDQPNSQVDFTMTDAGGTTVYNEVLDYGTIPAQFLDENRIFPGFFLPPAVEETYTGVYTVSADSTDFDPTDNQQSYSFMVSDSVMAKEDGQGIFTVTTAAGVTELTWSMAASYFIPHGSDPNDPNILYECSSVLINVGNTNANIGGFLSIYLYEWEDVNNDGVSQAVERGAPGAVAGNIVGNFTYELTADDVDGDILIDLENWDGSGDPLFLKDETTYVLTVGLTPPTSSTSKISIGGNNNQDYLATNFLTDSIGIERIACMWNTTQGDGGLNSDLNQVIFSPRLRMHIGEVIVESVNKPLDEANKVSVYPNPATDVLNLDLDLVEQMDEAVIRIIDINARTIMEKRYSDLDSQTLIYDVSSLPAGNYFLKLQSDQGYSTQKFTVVR